MPPGPPPPGYVYPDLFSQPSQPFMPYAPGLGSFGQSNPVMASLLQMALSAQMSGGGNAFLGVSDQNMFDRMDQMRLSQQAFQQMTTMAQYDRPAIQNVVKGVYHQAGRPFGEAGREFADTLSGAWPTIGPTMTMMFPDMVDAAFGMRGSSIAFTQGAIMAERGMLDPMSRDLGMSGSNATKLTQEVWRQMYEGNRYLSAPMSAGQAGQLWRELQHMGMMTNAGNVDELADTASGMRAIRKVIGDNTDFTTLTPDQKRKLLEDPGVADEMRGLDASKVAGTIKDWGKSIEALKEIFGEAGMPNAPIPVLFQALRQLTSGGTTTLHPSELTSMVRTMTNLAQTTGLGLQGLTVLSQTGEITASQMGIRSEFVPQASIEAMGALQAFVNLERGTIRGWTMPTPSEFAMTEQRLALSGRASQMGQQVGAAWRMLDTFGEGVFAKGSAAADYMNKLRKGEAVDLMTSGEWADMMSQGTLGTATQRTADDFLEILNQTRTNEPYLHRHPMSSRSIAAARRADILGGLVTPGAMESTAGMLSGLSGLSAQQQEGVGKMLADTFSREFGSDKYDTRYNDERNRTAMIDHFANKEYDDLKKAAAGGDANAQAFLRQFGNDEGKAKAFLRNAANMQVGGVNEYANDNGYKGYGDVQSHLDPRVAAEAARMESNQAARGVVQEMFGRAGKGGILRRFAEEFQKEGGGGTLWEIMTRVAGTSSEELRKAFKAKGITDEEINQARKDYAEVEKLQRVIQDPNSTQAQKDEALEKMNKLGDSYGETFRRMSEAATKFGVPLGDTTAQKGTLEASLERMHAAADMGGLSRPGMKKELHEIREEIDLYGKDKSKARRLGKEGSKKLEEIEGMLEQVETDDSLTEDKRKEILNRANKEFGELVDQQAKAKEGTTEIAHLYIHDNEVGNGATLSMNDPPPGGGA